MKKSLLRVLAWGSFSLLALNGCGVTPASQSAAISSEEASSEAASSEASLGTSSSELPVSSTSVAPVYDSATYANPIYPLSKTGTAYKQEVADPSSIVKATDGYYYLYSTDRREFRSADLCTWEWVTDSFLDLPTWGDPSNLSSTHIWAPDVVKVGDQWIMYYALSAWGAAYGIGYATAEDAGGPWTDQGALAKTDEIGIGNCIDPFVYVDTDGSVYMTAGSFQGIYIFELASDGMSCKGSVATQSANKVKIAGSLYEGSYITKRGDSYLLWLSAGSCCEGANSKYRVYAGKSDLITGPYTDSKGILMTDDNSTNNLVVWAGMASDKPYAGPGHNSVFRDDAGDDWLYYHSYCDDDHYATRHLFLDKILYDSDGYPYLKDKKPSYQEELDGPRFKA